MTEQKLQPVRGTKDLYGEDIKLFNHIIQTAKFAALTYGFGEIATPIFEFSEVFERNLGEASDIISKEVYKFPDRGDNFLTLRPEFTAGVVRAFISNGELQQILPQKFFSCGPLFRYERPQKGRQRQFHQINFELIGADSFFSDVEVILLASRILKDLGVLTKTELQINSLGCEASRANYQKALIAYFTEFKDSLSEDSKIRLEKNPLRILDSKDPKDQELVANAPVINEFYEAAAKENLENILKTLNNFGIKYKFNPRLVRGLDYYTSTVFEFVSCDLGAQDTVLAGGRYDKLIAKMGGPEVPAIGFAAGVERLMLMSEFTSKAIRPVSVIYVSENEQEYALRMVSDFRSAGIVAEICYGANFKKQMKRASQANSKFVIVVSGVEEKISVGKLVEFLSKSF
jgi:histidyl-tRNA synthetase